MILYFLRRNNSEVKKVWFRIISLYDVSIKEYKLLGGIENQASSFVQKTIEFGFF